MSVSLLPWCILLGKLYPVFLYAYANCHFLKTGQKSMKLSAHAAGKEIGVESFNKSTLCRIWKNKSFYGILTSYAETSAEQTDPYFGDIAAYVSELLEHST